METQSGMTSEQVQLAILAELQKLTALLMEAKRDALVGGVKLAPLANTQRRALRLRP